MDIDSSESPACNRHEQPAYNSHVERVCYHPLFCFNQYGDCERAMHRPGNAHSVRGCKECIQSIIDRYLEIEVRLLYRTVIAFAKSELFKHLAPNSIGFGLRFPYKDVFQ